jgi:hypothetical protein
MHCSRKASSACLPIFITIDDDDGPQNHLPNHEIAFNIHNPSLDHRDRGKRLRLPSYLQIETTRISTSPFFALRARVVSDLG